MLRWLDSLRVQLVLLVIAALVLAQALSLWLFVDERSLAVRAALGFEAASRAANVARLIEDGEDLNHRDFVSESQEKLVATLVAEHGTEALRPIFEATEGKIGYGKIKIIIAGLGLR